MATLSHSESRRLYSWWWDSHISPKNSKWLQENLTDMNAKVKTMIKLIEEDADSFAKRAEMYYKKRPELMKLVEDFYRAYRALAERYDHATGALRQAHRTIAEAFPNQDPFVLADDSPSGSSVCEIEPHTPESPHPVRVMLEPEDLHKDALGLSMSHFHAINRNAAKSDSVTNKKGLKQLNDLFGSEEGAPHYVKFAEGGMKKGLSYQKEDRNHSEHEKHIGYRDQSNHFMKENLKTQIKSSSERANKVETEVETLKVALAKLEAEKEAGLLQYQHALKRLSNLEAEVSHAQEDARGLNQRASKAETEVQTLNDALMKLQAEKEVGLLQFQQCIERMSNLEKKFSHVQEDASINVETEAQRLKQALARVEAEKEASFLQYNLCLEKISNLETKVSLAEENARHLNERAVRAETEVKFLKEAIAKLAEEKEAAALQYQHSLETTSALQSEVSHAQEEATRLSSVIVMGVAKLSSIEEQYIQLERENQSLQSEIDTLEQVMTLQKQELSEKLEELEKLESCIEEEYRRTMEAEAAVQTLQNLQSECQEEREALALEVQNGGQRLKDKELEYQGLEEETRCVKEQNGILNEQNGLLIITEKSAQDEIFRLREAEVKLGKEIEVLGDQRKALQQEIYFLKEELDDLKKRNQNVIEQMELVGLKPDCFGSSVKSLYDENSRLQEICQKNNVEKESLSEKLKNMENTLEKNALLEDSLLGLNTGLELLREKVKTLEETCQSLKRVNTTVLDEKESLVSRLEMANRNVEKLLEKNIFLVNFLFDANVERAWLREKAKSLEEFCQSLDNENHNLFTAKDNLVSQFENIQQKLDDLVRKYTDLEENHSCLEKEMEAKVHQVEELQATLNLEKQEHASFIHSSETHLAHLEGNNRVLQEEGKRRLKEFEDEQDTAVKAQLEIFILQRFVRDLKERNLSLFIEYQNHLETSKLSENLATNLERENFEQQVKINSLLDRVERLRFGICQMALSLKNNPAYECQAEVEEDQVLQMAMRKLEDLESSLWSAEDERHHLLFEKSVFLTVLGQLRLEAARIESERSALHRDLQLRTDDLLLLQGERNKLRSETDNLYHQIGIGKDILSQKEMELSETKQKLKTLESENMELNSKLKDLSSEFEEARITRELLEKKIFNISENNSHKSEEIESLHEATEKLELELNRLHEEIKEQRVKEDNLSSELQQKRNEIKLWEYEAETMYCNCQATNIHAALFKEKAHELVGACESLEDERDSKTEDIEQLKERLRVFELENKGVKSKLAAYLPVVVSLRECVTSLEDRVILQTKNYEADNPEKEVADFASPQHDSNKELTENQSLLVADGVLDLLELQARIKKIETSVVEQKRLIMQESFDKNIKLDAAMRTIQKLEQIGNGSSYRTEPDFSDVGNEILVKDIPLDQVSQCSSYDHGFVPQAMSRREDAEIKEEILELWDIVEQDLDLNLTFNQKQKLAAVPTQEKSDFCQNETVDQKSECPSSEIQSEEMSVASESVTVHQEGNKRKILERLASDAQKLMNLQVTVQDLRKKVEKLEKYKKPKDTEFTTVKEQLKEVEEAIMQLVGTNDKLSKKAERHPVAADGKLTVDLEETGKARRCRISERARRASEKIGRLHLEVQRIQFVLLKLEDKYKTKGTDRKVLLKDYLYGNLRSPPSNKRKKRLFFISCVKPPTSLD